MIQLAQILLESAILILLERLAQFLLELTLRRFPELEQFLREFEPRVQPHHLAQILRESEDPRLHHLLAQFLLGQWSRPVAIRLAQILLETDSPFVHQLEQVLRESEPRVRSPHLAQNLREIEPLVLHD
jgi:hypothetical protein